IVVALMLLGNILLKSNLGMVLLDVFIFLLIFVFIAIFKDKISKWLPYVLVGILFAVGIAARIHLLLTADVRLESDFQLYYNTALSIMKHPNAPDLAAYYLSYNGYVYTFSTVLAGFMSIFGTSVPGIYIFQMVCQAATAFFIFLIAKERVSPLFGLLAAAAWFILPTVIFAGFLVSTETFFMLLMMGCFYFFDRFTKIKLFKHKLILAPVFGILIAITNGIRPAMTLFVVAFVVYVLLCEKKKLRELLVLGLLIIVFFGTNQALAAYNGHGIGEGPRSGASGWSIYFGANEGADGGWTVEDSEYVFSVLEHTENGDMELTKQAISRYADMGAGRTAKLMWKKFSHLWSDNNSTAAFVNACLNNPESMQDVLHLYNTVADIMAFLILIGAILGSVLELKRREYNNLFLQFFVFGYALSNLFMVLNGRYNYPVYPLLIIIAASAFKKYKPKEIEVKEVVACP
ncbi:MAG: glycosyltransferase family 39 protein, partial [Clostridia bacterium]|nr:glycosyltransferase family 39 protein [Clostridia bacterium]